MNWTANTYKSTAHVRSFMFWITTRSFKSKKNHRGDVFAEIRYRQPEGSSVSLVQKIFPAGDQDKARDWCERWAELNLAPKRTGGDQL